MPLLESINRYTNTPISVMREISDLMEKRSDVSPQSEARGVIGDVPEGTFFYTFILFLFTEKKECPRRERPHKVDEEEPAL